MSDRVDAIKGEYASKMEEHDKLMHNLFVLPLVDHLNKLEEKEKVLKKKNNNIIEKLWDMTSQIITNEYANVEFMDEYVKNQQKKLWCL